MHLAKWPTLLLAICSIILTGAPVRGQGTSTLRIRTQDNGFLGTAFSLDCTYVYSAQEVTRSVFFYRKRELEPKFSEIAKMEVRTDFITNPNPVWNDTALQTRASVKMSNRTLLSLTISSIDCGDRAEYQCKYFVSNQTAETNVTSGVETFDVAAKPGVPQISYTPSIIAEKEVVQFTCESNVGRPAGDLAMFLVRNGQESPLPSNSGSEETALNSCTFTRKATGSYNITASDNGRVSVRCRVQQQYSDPSVNVNTTQSLNVQYAPRNIAMLKKVDSSGETEIIAGGSVVVPVESQVDLRCRADSNPSASYVWSYILDGTNETKTSDGAVLSIRDISLDKSGQYSCVATNVVKNVSLSTQPRTFTLNVSRIPTTPPTLPPTEAPTSPDTSRKPGKSTQGPDNAGLIGGVVGGVVALVIIIVIIVFVIKRRKNKQPDEPSKPRNNQDSRTVVVHPHMVSSPGKYDNFDNYNKGYEKNEKELYYADLKFDDTPRSRKPVQILSEPTNYAEVAWPRV